MIGRLRGQVAGHGEGWTLVDVNGVGYLVEISTRTMTTLPPQGEAVTLAIETHVREDQLRLFGFLSEAERGWFRLLLGVQGVGAKVALAIQSVLSERDLAAAVASGDKAMVARAPGVGPKVAQRIVQELKDKIPDMGFADIKAEENAPMGDALSALINLGYPRAQAHAALRAIASERAQSTETLIRLALQALSA